MGPFAPVGHDAVLAELRRVWAQQAGPRTLLFAGPDQVGRRAAARWLGALLNCSATDPLMRPCGECESCRLLIHGTHPDLKEVSPTLLTEGGRLKRDPEIRIDQLVARERGDPEPLGPWLAIRPRFRYRVGIIDGADALNVAAANAFLKVLEEPPPWAVIVLVAPGPRALLPTVASRCITLRFGAVGWEELGRSAEFPSLPPELEDHPALRLGQPGALLRAARSAEGAVAAKVAASEFLSAVEGDLLDALNGAEALAKALNAAGEDQASDPLIWLRESLRATGHVGYAAAVDAVARCEAALSAYAQAALACSVLALELRTVLAVAR